MRQVEKSEHSLDSGRYFKIIEYFRYYNCGDSTIILCDKIHKKFTILTILSGIKDIHIVMQLSPPYNSSTFLSSQTETQPIK